VSAFGEDAINKILGIKPSTPTVSDSTPSLSNNNEPITATPMYEGGGLGFKEMDGYSNTTESSMGCGLGYGGGGGDSARSSEINSGWGIGLGSSLFMGLGLKGFMKGGVLEPVCLVKDQETANQDVKEEKGLEKSCEVEVEVEVESVVVKKMKKDKKKKDKSKKDKTRKDMKTNTDDAGIVVEEQAVVEIDEKRKPSKKAKRDKWGNKL
jgi:hypothetical protein